MWYSTAVRSVSLRPCSRKDGRHDTVQSHGNGMVQAPARALPLDGGAVTLVRRMIIAIIAVVVALAGACFVTAERRTKW